MSCLELGTLAEAEETLRAAVVASDRLGLRDAAAIARSNLGLALSLRGAHREACAVLRECIQTLAARSNRGRWRSRSITPSGRETGSVAFAVPPPAQASFVDARLLATLEREFSRHAGADARIDARELRRALGLRSEYLASRVLAAFDRDRDGFVAKDEFLEGVRQLVLGSDRDKLAFAFRVHDQDGDGFIDEKELHRMIVVSLAESDVAERASQPSERLANALLLRADRDRDGRISFEELEEVVRQHPAVLRRMTRSEALWIAPNEDLLSWVDGTRAPRRGRLGRFLENRWLPILLLVLWIGANVAVFLQTLLARGAPGTNGLMQLGRALGACLDLDGALILVPMMRRVLSWVRSTWLGRVVPVDDAILFHKLVGHTMFGLALAHAAVFVAAYAAGHGGAARVDNLLFLTARGLTGFVLLVVFALMWAFSLGPVRRSSHFELFYFTHLLYVVWLVLAVAHAPSFLILAGVPLVGFGVEQLLRLRKRRPAAPIIAADALRSGVTRLELARPPGFVFDAGDYVFLRIPEIAEHEWHPFTLSSAPESSNLTMHVRSLGNWTAALRRRVEDRRALGVSAPMEAYVDGPYGSPSGHIWRSEVAVFIGAGIGVTPFASVLGSLVARESGGAPSRLRKAHFFWLNRDQYSFEWFAALLGELEHEDHQALLDVHLCMTDGRADATALALELARDLMHEAGGADIVTGLRTHTHMGEPDWTQLLGTIGRSHAPTVVDVYFCGPSGLGHKLRRTATGLGMRFREEKF